MWGIQPGLGTQKMGSMVGPYERTWGENMINANGSSCSKTVYPFRLSSGQHFAGICKDMMISGFLGSDWSDKQEGVGTVEVGMSLVKGDQH